MIMIVAVLVAVLPHSSVAVKTTSVVPSQFLSNPLKSDENPTSEHSSVAEPPPWLLTQFSTSWFKLGSEHSSVIF